MATWDFPLALMPKEIVWRSIKAGVQFRSPFDGTVESIEFPGARWGISLTLPQRSGASGGQPESFFGRLAGGVERVRIWHFQRPQPLGSMRGTPTLNAAAVRGDLVLKINTTGSLRAGDMFKVGAQLCMAFQDCTASGGVLTVPLVQRVRGTLASGAPVSWDKPTAEFVMPANTSDAGYFPGGMAGMACELVEVY